MGLISSPDFILTKNAIIQKLVAFFQELESAQKEIINRCIGKFPGEVLKPSSKISKGENYRGMPWLVLDHPRYFEKNNVCAIRTMFWWGNFFSLTLHLSGRYKQNMEERIIGNRAVFARQGFYICTGPSQWDHHFEKTNYEQAGVLTDEEFRAHIIGKPFLKIATKFPVQELSLLEGSLKQAYQYLTENCF